MTKMGPLPRQALSQSEVAAIMTRRGIPTSAAYVAVCESRALKKIAKALGDDEEILNYLKGKQ